MNERSREHGLEPQALGNPRFDLLRPELRGLYDDEVAKLRTRFGRFILINGNFANVNCAPEK